MQSIAELRHHIAAVEQTRKITNAMHLISAARMRKLMARLAYNTRYLEHVQSAMGHILAAHESIEHPYLREAVSGATLYVVLAGERGMVGAYHAEILKFAHARICEAGGGAIFTFGKAATRYFEKQSMQPKRNYHFGADGPGLEDVRHSDQDIFRLVDAGEISRVYLIYPHFQSAANCHPVMRRLLPLDCDALELGTAREEMLCHPSPEKMMQRLIPQYTLGILYGALMQTYAGEHNARMHAMQSATRNADEFLKELRMQYNMARQGAITQEILEIMGAANAQTEKGTGANET